MTDEPVPVAAPRVVSLYNAANALTVVRLVLVPVFLAMVVTSQMTDHDWRIGACLAFCVASATDFVDGWIARKWQLVTSFGKIADPIADKAITGMAFIGLSIVGDIWWWVTILVLAREWSVTLLRLSVLRDVVMPASQLGKIKTTLQAVALSGLCLPLRQVEGSLDLVGEILFYASQVMLAGAVAMTLWSGYEFYREIWRQRRAARTV